MASNKKSSNSRKIFFEGVNPDLLRATSPNSPKENSGKVVSFSSSKEKEKSPSSHDVTSKQSREKKGSKKIAIWGGTLKPKNDPYGLRKGKEACLRSVLQRLRSGQMSAIEEAKAMCFLIEHQVVQNQAELAQVMEKPKSKVSEKLSILKLPRSVQLLMERHPHSITSGHAIELLRLKDPALISNAATRILEQKLSRDRLRTEISFLLDKHGGANHSRPLRRKNSAIRFFPKVDGGFDVIYRFRSQGDQEDLEKMIAHMESKIVYLKQVLSTRLIDQKNKTKKRESKNTPSFLDESVQIIHS